MLPSAPYLLFLAVPAVFLLVALLSGEFEGRKARVPARISSSRSRRRGQ